MKLSSYQNLRVSNFSAHILRDVLAGAQIDWLPALENADISEEAIERLGGTIPARKELAFQLQFVELTQGRVDLWIQAAQSYTLSSMGDRGLAFLSAPTVEAWADLICATDVGYGLHDIAQLWSGDGELIGIQIGYGSTPEELIDYGVHRDFVWVIQILSMLYNKAFPFIRAELPLDELSSELLEYAPCEVVAGADVLRIWWDPAVSGEKLPYGNAFQHETWIKSERRIVDELQASGDWAGTVSKVIREAPEANRNLENVAAALHASPRTLQRKLSEAGTSFAELRDRCLSEVASELLLNTSYSIGKISRDLGYVDPASFTLAFKRWKGVPPTLYREGARYKGKAPSILLSEEVS